MVTLTSCDAAPGTPDAGAASGAAAAEAGAPAVALVVCTRDRAARLPATLAALARLRVAAPWELVLVDSASRDHTPELLRGFAADAPMRVRLVRCGRPGLGRARNAGVAATRAPLLVFVDDDCYPAPDLLDRWLDAFAADPTLGYAAGRIVLHDPADAPVTIRPETAPFAIAPGAYVVPGVVQGAHLAMRRSVLDAVGGFDPALGPGTPFNCEDVELAARLSAAGVAGGFRPEPMVAHHHGRRAGPALDALRRSYDRGRGAYHLALLLQPGMRRQAVRAWAGSLRGSAWPVLGRELAGALRYAALRARRRPDRTIVRRPAC